MSRWFRFYDEAIHDAKVLLLPTDALRWQWIVLLAVASLNKGKIPSVEIAALALRVKPAKASEIIAVNRRPTLTPDRRPMLTPSRDGF